MKLSSLTDTERLALGGLLRLLVRADGEFSEQEEEKINALGDELGGREQLWRAISDSAQAFKTDQDIRAAGIGIERPEVRTLTLRLLKQVALSDSMSPGEEGILSALSAAWK